MESASNEYPEYMFCGEIKRYQHFLDEKAPYLELYLDGYKYKFSQIAWSALCTQ